MGKLSSSSRCVVFTAAMAITVSFAALVVALTLGLRTKSSADTGSEDNGPPSTVGPDEEAASKYHSAFGEYRFASVASDGPECSKIGTDILGKKHGSAVDAAIATMICVGAVNAHSSGIGGGHFMTTYAVPNDGKEKVMKAMLARERAPLKATQDMYVNGTLSSKIGGSAIGVPGEVKGFYEAWKLFGKVDWKDLYEPTIKLCRDGVPVHKALATAVAKNEEIIKDDPLMRELFVDPKTNDIYKEGDKIIMPKLAQTLERISEDPFTFYNGSLAEDIIADIKDHDGIIELEDLQGYEASLKTPLNVSLDYSDLTVFGLPPPSSGVVLEYILKILDGYRMRPEDITSPQVKVLTYHRIIEAFKFAFAKRSALGDEDFVNVTEIIENMTSDDYIKNIRAKINDDHTENVTYYEPSWEDSTSSGTAHASILAPDGSAVSITSTINFYFGSKRVGNRTGIIFNNQMDDFSTPGTANGYGLPASPSNFVKPGKMPMSSMCPVIFLDKNGENVKFITGASGGTRIITGTAQVAINTLFLGMRLDDATNQPRFHHQLVPTILYYEEGMSKELLEGLKSRGHTIMEASSTSVSQSIHKVCDDGNDCIQAVSDGRKSGKPDGY